MVSSVSNGGKAELTVVMPTYNRRVLLERAIESVLIQMRRDDRIRIHVWDNNSQDDTGSFMRGVMSREKNIHYTHRPENIGAIANYRDALSRVETDYYVGLADDDYLIGDFLTDALDSFEKDPSLAAVAMQTLHVDTAGEIIRINPCDQWDYKRLEPAETMNLWCRHGHLEWSSIAFRKAVYDAVGGLDLKYGLAVDAAFQMNVFLKYPVLFVKKPAAIYNLHDQQHTSMHAQQGITSAGIRYVEEALLLISEMEVQARENPALNASIKLFRQKYSTSFARAWRTGSAKTLYYLVSRIALSFREPRQAFLCVVWWLVSRFPVDLISVWKKSKKPRNIGNISEYTHLHSWSREDSVSAGPVSGSAHAPGRPPHGEADAHPKSHRAP